jgi:predicted transcriptional regulator
MHTINFQKEELSEKEKRNVDILEILRKRGPISRPDISKEMGINVVTISNYIDEFIKRNLVYEKELDVSEGGRRPVLLDLNPQAGFVIGVGLNLMNMVGKATLLPRPRLHVRAHPSKKSPSVYWRLFAKSCGVPKNIRPI